MKSFAYAVATALVLGGFSASADEEFYERKETVRSHKITEPKQERLYVPVYELAPVREIHVPVFRSYVVPFSAKPIVRGSKFRYTEIRRGLLGRPKSILEIEGD